MRKILLLLITMSAILMSCEKDNEIVTVKSTINFNVQVDNNGEIDGKTTVYITNIATSVVDTVYADENGKSEVTLEVGTYDIKGFSTVDYPTKKIAHTFTKNNVIFNEETINKTLDFIKTEETYKKFNVSVKALLEELQVNNIEIYLKHIALNTIDTISTKESNVETKAIAAGTYTISASFEDNFNNYYILEEDVSVLKDEILEFAMLFKSKKVVQQTFQFTDADGGILANRTITIQDKVSLENHVVTTDENGKATIELETGQYTSSYRIYEKKYFNGDVQIMETNPQLNISLTLVENSVEKFVISELYYKGSKTPENKTYSYDQFIEIYNNSNEILYLDGLCFGYNQASSYSMTKWLNESGELMDQLPVFGYSWMIPGNGTDRPLEPGKSIIISTIPINHTTVNSNSFDLSNADWQFYINTSERAIKYPDTKSLTMFGLTLSPNASRYPIHMGGPAAFIYRLPNNSITEYESDPNSIQLRPGSTRTDAAMVNKSWVIDAVECVKSESKKVKRLHSTLDAGYVFGTEYGKSISRKVKETIGDRVVYMDTNNSTDDFSADVVPTPNAINN